MKKNIIQIVLFSVIILLIGLLIGQYFANKPVNETQSDYFAKNQECSKYKDSVETKLNEANVSVAETSIQTFNSLDKIFYSPKVNSCLYVATETMYVDGKITYETPTLTDALTGELLLASLREVGSEDYLTRKEQFENTVKDYE